MIKNITPAPDWIIYQDQDIVAVNKPSGLLSVPGKNPEHKTCVLSYLHLSHPSALIVHRLDMDTSGILLLALNKASHRALSIQFQERQTSKVYHALAAGKLSQTKGFINLPMRCDWENRPRQIIDFNQGRSAQTEWTLLNQYSNYFSVALYPITGRSHQLRVHMKSLGHPILGDNLYADKSTDERVNRLMLHATELQFTHPTKQHQITLRCPVDFI
ncbi:RluA family pseudouridine synthase [Thiomicrospira sp. R3]|uniref:RluA family pseudouridine synthase n=1 Tax=Thiomicrospira sp. R3 TaxID=3035472 RepID=UPI00259BA9ED|nr:RluA family pseudouridine synthase [Thiomicrospira sp. R3]WFE68843.1 RluA family pseudouridine synthase [Thiomicrospira sp. R3]